MNRPEIGASQAVDIHCLPPSQMAQAAPLGPFTPPPLQNTARGPHSQRKAFGQLPDKPQTPHMKIGSNHQTARKGKRIASIQNSDAVCDIGVETVGQNLRAQSRPSISIPHKREVRKHQMAICKAGGIAPRDSIPSHNESRATVSQNFRLEVGVQIFLVMENQNLGIEAPHLLAQNPMHPFRVRRSKAIFSSPLILQWPAIQNHFHEFQSATLRNRTGPKIRSHKHLAHQPGEAGRVILPQRRLCACKQCREHFMVVTGCLENPHFKRCSRNTRCPRRRGAPSEPEFPRHNSHDIPTGPTC